ncbi:MAG: alpha/beta hydrolase [Jatrophihabitans sp.]|uniref:alpha/beta hydrolase n=1 Tax=Jatrophihabitans sp. TaxID=1932789 RepID=UPI0039105164
MTTPRRRVQFPSDDTQCAAWYYPGTNGACVVMAGGFAVPKEPATDQFARRFHEAGFSVLAFDYRGLGESGGAPRLVFPVGRQLADWRAAINFARSRPGVDPGKVALWAFSASGGFVLSVAASDPHLAAVIAQTPNADGLAALRNARRHQKAAAMLRFTGRALLDAAGSLVGQPPRLVALTGPPGTVAMLTTPDSLDGQRALHAADYPHWQQQVAARSALRIAFYRPGRHVRRIQVPLLVLVCDDDQTSLAAPAAKAAHRAPRGELSRMPGGHYEPFLDGHDHAVDVELDFLQRHVLPRPAQLGMSAKRL